MNAIYCLVSSKVREDGSRFLKLQTVYPAHRCSLWTWTISAHGQFPEGAHVAISVLRSYLEMNNIDVGGGYIADLTTLERGGVTKIILFPFYKP